MNDLNPLLRNWQPDVPEPSAFRRNVWRRIADQQTRAKPAFAGWIENFLALLLRPSHAAAAAAIAIAVGIGIGGTLSARNESGAIDYLRSVNPYAQIRS